MKRIAIEPAYLLSLRPYQETSALLEVFTAAHGRVGLVARGVKTAKSRLRGLLQPFARLLLSWVERGELGTLTGAEVDGSGAATPGASAGDYNSFSTPAGLRGEAVFSGWYLNELLLRLLVRHDAHPVLFKWYADTLNSLTTPRGPAGLRLFEKHLLQELGYGLHLPESLPADAWYGYDSETGPHPAAARSDTSYRGASLLALAHETLDTDESLRDAKRLLRAALAPHLGDRPMETPRLMRALRRAVKAGEAAHA